MVCERDRTIVTGEIAGGLGARVVDASGAGVVGIPVTFTVTGGTFAGGATTATATSNAAGIAVAPSVSSDVPGELIVSASAASHETTNPTLTVVAPAATLDADVTITPTTVNGRVVLVFDVTNTGSETATIKVKTRFGTKTFADLAAGASASSELKVGLATLPSGTATVTLTGASGSASFTVTHPAH